MPSFSLRVLNFVLHMIQSLAMPRSEFQGTSITNFHRLFPEHPHAHRWPLDLCPDSMYFRERVTVFLSMARLLM